MRFFVVARKAGYACAWDVLFPFRSQVVRLAYGQVTNVRQHCLLVLEPASVLAGHVVDADGRPVAGARVQAIPVTSYLRRLQEPLIRAPTEWFTATTDAQGGFRFEQFAADVTAGFHVKAPGRASTYTFRRHFQVPCAFGGVDIRLALPAEGTIKGRVVDPRGQPTSGIRLSISLDPRSDDIRNRYAKRTAVSDKEGNFTFEGIPEGRHEIGLAPGDQGTGAWVALPVAAVVRAGQVIDGVVVHLTEGGICEVHALNAQTRQPLAGAYVDLGNRQWTPPGETQPEMDVNGIVRIRALAGQYGVCVRAYGFEYARLGSRAVVYAGRTLQVTIPLNPYPRLTGRVCTRDGKPAGDIPVHVSPGEDMVRTDSQGRFIADAEPHSPEPHRFVLARGAEKGLAAFGLFQDPGESFTLTLEPAWTLVGRVTDPNGVGIPAARVFLWDLDEVLCDPDGRFEFKAIPPMQGGGTYTLEVYAAGFSREPRDSGPATEISPSGPPGARVDLGTIRLFRADASVSGTVYYADGLPAANMPVLANYKVTITDDKGRFTIARLLRVSMQVGANFGNSPLGSGSVTTQVPARDLKIVIKAPR
jgi:protocatechuate 3,4-dioxygenase beta subunit